MTTRWIRSDGSQWPTHKAKARQARARKLRDLPRYPVKAVPAPMILEPFPPIPLPGTK